MEKNIGAEAFKDSKRIIIVAAHPDDMETLCGGTLSILIPRGVEIFSVNCTLGDIGAQDSSLIRQALATTRMAETKDAARVLGITHIFNLGHHDGELVPDLNLRAQISRLYRITGADTLMTFDPFWSGQIHPDHRAAGQAAIDAYMPSKMPLYRPEQLNEPGAILGQINKVFLFSTDRDPDVFVDVTPVYKTKLAACIAHRSQFPRGEESLEWLKEIDRRQGKVINVPFAESFRQMSVW
jgi:LmbE family N-acetylglucosaminyl deacetylase